MVESYGEQEENDLDIHVGRCGKIISGGVPLMMANSDAEDVHQSFLLPSFTFLSCTVDYGFLLNSTKTFVCLRLQSCSIWEEILNIFFKKSTFPAFCDAVQPSWSSPTNRLFAFFYLLIFTWLVEPGVFHLGANKQRRRVLAAGMQMSQSFAVLAVNPTVAVTFSSLEMAFVTFTE